MVQHYYAEPRQIELIDNLSFANKKEYSQTSIIRQNFSRDSQSVSTERLYFGKYCLHEMFASPNLEGPCGESSWRGLTVHQSTFRW